MVNAEYACAYKEVIELLKYMPIEDVKKIPPQKILYLLNNMDKNYNYIIDETKTFEEQKKSKITESIFAVLFRNYWATPTQKEKILAKINYDFLKMEEKKRELYNPNAIFQAKKKKTKVETRKKTDINPEKSIHITTTTPKPVRNIMSKEKTTITTSSKPIQYRSKNFWHKILSKIKQFFQKS